MIKREIQYYLAYSTANDDKYYVADFLNFMNMKNHSPGVHSLKVYIAISKVRDFSKQDSEIVSKLVKTLEDCPWITVKKVIIKGNIGRDFSSIKVCLEEISKEAKAEDQIMIKNRSGYGPFSINWFSDYFMQYKKLGTKGLIGSTINFCGHPERPRGSISNTHVQTYVLFSEFGALKPLIEDFPASRCTSRFDLIAEGEIGLSQYFLSKDMRISSLYWPDKIFSKNYYIDKSLPMDDIKGKARKLPIRYKYKQYLFLNNPFGLLKWLYFCKFYRNKTVKHLHNLLIYKKEYD